MKISKVKGFKPFSLPIDTDWAKMRREALAKLEAMK